jgi:hypothetical protein
MPAIPPCLRAILALKLQLKTGNAGDSSVLAGNSGGEITTENM